MNFAIRQPFTSYMTTDKSFNLFESQFPLFKIGDNNRIAHKIVERIKQNNVRKVLSAVLGIESLNISYYVTQAFNLQRMSTNEPCQLPC